MGETNVAHMVLDHLERWIDARRQKLAQSVDRIGQNVNVVAPTDSAVALVSGLIFSFWFRDDNKLSQLISFAFLKALGFIF